MRIDKSCISPLIYFHTYPDELLLALFIRENVWGHKMFRLHATWLFRSILRADKWLKHGISVTNLTISQEIAKGRSATLNDSTVFCGSPQPVKAFFSWVLIGHDRARQSFTCFTLCRHWIFRQFLFYPLVFCFAKAQLFCLAFEKLSRTSFLIS